MQGIFIGHARPKSKKQIKETYLTQPELISLEATSYFGNEYGGPLLGAPKNEPIYFVGPNPHSDRRFYGSITWNPKTGSWKIA